MYYSYSKYTTFLVNNLRSRKAGSANTHCLTHGAVS